MSRAQTWLIGRMIAWHEGPHGGRCPRTDGPECSQYGVAAVQEHGAVAGALRTVRYLITCRASDPDENPICPPRRWAALLPLMVGLHLKEALPKPQPGSCPFLILSLVLVGDESYKNWPCLLLLIHQEPDR